LGDAFDAARLRGARLRVVHAWQLPTTLVDAGYTVEDEDARPELRVRLSEACARLRSEHPEVECVEDVVLEHPVKALTSRSRGASLLRSEEHTSELQSRENLVCRLLLEKKKKTTHTT